MKKIWNLPSYPVYSLSTLNIDGTYNMNICTYAVPVSMKPKLFCVAVYHGTKTYENILRDKHFVLQYLSASQHKLLTPLGRKSGIKASKHEYVKKISTVLDNGYPLLNDCAGYIDLQVNEIIEVGGDHALVVCSVIESKTIINGSLLYWNI